MPGRRLGLTSFGAAIVLIMAFAVGIAVPRVQLLLPPLIAVVLVAGHVSWHVTEQARRRLDRRVAAALVVGYVGLAALIGFTAYFVWKGLQTVQGA